jgi:hypothetical protein
MAGNIIQFKPNTKETVKAPVFKQGNMKEVNIGSLLIHATYLREDGNNSDAELLKHLVAHMWATRLVVWKFSREHFNKLSDEAQRRILKLS